ncbi:response regulator transcription factor [Saccharopolyspora elongata]|uniref:Response regulator transcription factor n=1 Tax=Saccharopolyspora elongata TaxID=2530387 RepID=A0A4R4Z007_9PSEU|nr:response regulator transcription factor [Saccharopolyspora elongata]TDD51123.1 response regulator transcription factor [Saccharopolyspora elongata]
MTIRVVVADDQQLIRSALTTVIGLHDDLECVAEASTGREAVEACRAHRVDVVLMDIRMPGLDGIAATGLITGGVPGTRVLVLTTFDLDENLFAVLRAGASGFLTKDTPGEDVVEAVRTVHKGHSIVSPRATGSLLELARRAAPRHRPEWEALTGRERDVLVSLARGSSNAEIGAELHLAETTVKTHVGAILRKLAVRDRLHAVIWAYENGVV